LTAGHATNLFDEYRILPNPVVQKRPLTGVNWKMERDPNEDGLAIMRKVIAKRLAAHEKTIEEMITSQALTLMTQTSGGVMRELIRSFRDAATLAQLLEKMQLDEAIVREVVDQQRQPMAARLTMSHIEALRCVLQQGALSGGQQEAMEDELMRGLYLLSYQEAPHSWFDVHPSVLPLL
jgi:DNA polymerase III delta prime subunit